MGHVLNINDALDARTSIQHSAHSRYDTVEAGLLIVVVVGGETLHTEDLSAVLTINYGT